MVYYLWFSHIYVPNLICNRIYYCDRLIFLITNRYVESFIETNQKNSNSHNSEFLNKFDFISEGMVENRIIRYR